MNKLISPIQQLILTTSGQKPTIPNPSTILPTDSRFNIESDLMIAQFAYNIIDDKWFYRSSSGIRELGNSTLSVDQVEVWNKNKLYYAGNIYVSYSNILSETPQFQTEAIYRCKGNTIVGESPETTSSKWEFQGAQATVNYVTNITVEDSDLYDPTKTYNVGAIVSYVNVSSSDELFHSLQLYTCVKNAAIAESPETNLYNENTFEGNWRYEGDVVTKDAKNTATTFVSNISELRNLSNIGDKHTVFVQSSWGSYKFDKNYNFGVKPYSNEAGSWRPLDSDSNFGSSNKLTAVVSAYDTDQSVITLPIGCKFIVTTPTNVDISDGNGNSAIINIANAPSIITRIGTGLTLDDFLIEPFNGGSSEIITVDDADAFDVNKIDGYPEGSIVSYINELAEAPFNELAVYVAALPISYIGDYPDGYVESPEQTSAWVWQGEELIIPTDNSSVAFVGNTTELQQVKGYKVGDSISVLNGYTYKYAYVGAFDPTKDLYPFDQVGNPNYCWTYRYYANDFSLWSKINYSGLRHVVYGIDTWDVPLEIDKGESIMLLNSSYPVSINGTIFENQPNCVIYNKRDGTGLEVIEFGGGGSTIISKTYAELQALVASNGLVQGQQYLLSDYQTKHVIPNSSPVELNTGALEPLILTATSTNEFHVEVKSITFPTDIIHYRFDDDSCEDGTRDSVNKKWTGGTARTGYISYRKSTTNNLSTYYDWRNYKVRRWKVDAVEWVSGTVYAQKTITKSTSDGNIYKCKKNTTINDITDPSLDTINWQLWMNTATQNNYNRFNSFTPTANDYTVGGISTDNLIINNTTQGTDFDDYYTFCILTEPNNSSGIIKESINNSVVGEGYYNFEIGRYDFDYFNYDLGNGNDLESNVFYLIPDGDCEYYVCDNTIGSNFTFNTFDLYYFQSNVIGNYFYSNTIGNNFESNVIGNYFSSNTIGNNFYTNATGNNFSSNTIDNDFYSNTIDNDFYSNTIGNNFSSNTIDNNFYSNTIGNVFNTNVIGNNFYSNTIGNYFQYNETKNRANNIDWINALPASTHVYSTYSVAIFKNSAGVNRLSYYDENDQLVITDITA